jgi:hypothetical protein
MLLVAQDALRKDMANQMACKASSDSMWRPGHGEQTARQAVVPWCVVRLLRSVVVTLAKVFLPNRTATPIDAKQSITA